MDYPLPRNENGFVFLKFSAKYYPEVLEDELIQEVTRHLFYLQVLYTSLYIFVLFSSICFSQVF